MPDSKVHEIYKKFEENYKLGRDQEHRIAETRAVEIDKGMVTIITAGLAYILVAILSESPHQYTNLPFLDLGVLMLLFGLILIFWSYHYLNWFSSYAIDYLDKHKEILSAAELITEKDSANEEDLRSLLNLRSKEEELNNSYNEASLQKTECLKNYNNLVFTFFSLGILSLTYFILSNIT